MVKAEHADTKDKFLRLWCHEESRVFRDRLISAEDRTWFNNALQVPLLPAYRPLSIAPTCMLSTNHSCSKRHSLAHFECCAVGRFSGKLYLVPSLLARNPSPHVHLTL